MKIVLGQMPLPHFPQISQNRQFQTFKHKSLIFPVMHGYLYTMLQRQGHEVHWLDAVEQGWVLKDYLSLLKRIVPDLIVYEAKTPIVSKMIETALKLREALPRASIFFVGDHVTARPNDFTRHGLSIIKGGFWDFELAGIKDFDLSKLPLINREGMNWRAYSKHGNYKHFPGTHTMFARDCWHRPGCSFCSWASLYPGPQAVMSVDHAISEVKNIIELGASEIFDDSGTFPVGNWLENFCSQLRRLNRGKHKIKMGCNMRPGRLTNENWISMAGSGFRFALIGFESANEKTLKKLSKGYTPQEIELACRWASRNKIDVHITSMFGYPWETREDAERTVKFVRNLFEKGYIRSVQATLCVPYPGTRLYDECRKEKKLLTENYENYDMKTPVMKCPMTPDELKEVIRSCYASCLSPKAVIRRIFSSSPSELIRGFGFLMSHLRDFK